MSYTYAEKKRPASAPQKSSSVPAAPALDALKAGAVQPTAEQLGRPVDLPGAIRAKMEASFGADLSAVKLYESQAVADAGANAVAQGSRIAFAPGKLDFASASGQALLGHELSHVVSQVRGEVTGSGFLRDAALEAQADREGAMAAAGEQVYAGPVTAPLSSAAPAAGPMQASKDQPQWEKDRGIASKWHPFKRSEGLMKYATELAAQERKIRDQGLLANTAQNAVDFQDNPMAQRGLFHAIGAAEGGGPSEEEMAGKLDLPSKWHPFRRSQILERYLRPRVTPGPFRLP